MEASVSPMIAIDLSIDVLLESGSLARCRWGVLRQGNRFACWNQSPAVGGVRPAGLRFGIVPNSALTDDCPSFVSTRPSMVRTRCAIVGADAGPSSSIGIVDV